MHSTLYRFECVDVAIKFFEDSIDCKASPRYHQQLLSKSVCSVSTYRGIAVAIITLKPSYIACVALLPRMKSKEVMRQQDSVVAAFFTQLAMLSFLL